MRSVQGKFLAAVEDAAAAYALEPVHQGEYVNTGTLYLHAPGGFDAKVTVAYEFRTSDATVYVSPLPTRADGARALAYIRKVARKGAGGRLLKAAVTP